VKKRSATVRAARWSATHPWRAIALWVVFVAVCSFVGQMAGEKKATDVDMGVGQSGHAAKVLHDAGLTDPAGENVLITAKSGSLNQGEAKAVAADISNRMRALSGVSKVDSPIVAPDGKALLVPITMKGDPDTAGDRVKPLVNATAAVAGQHPQLRVEEVGDASINDGVNKQLSKDFSKSEKLSVPVTLIILLVAFGAIIAAGVPVLLAISAVVAALGISTLATHLIPSNGSVSEVILLMGMAVGVDYSLFYLKREREERARNRGKIDAIEIAAATSGHSIVVSAMAVIVSMAGLYLAQDAIFSSIATGGVIVVAVAMLGSVTVLPALLAKLGRAVDRPRVPFLWRLTAIRSGEPRLWPKVLGPTLRHPVRALAISVLVLLGLAAPAIGMTLHDSTAQDLPRSIPAVQTYERMVHEFPSKGSSYDIVLKTDSGKAATVLPALQDRIKGNPLYAHDQPPTVKTSRDDTVTSIELATPYEANSKQAVQGLKELRNDILPATVGGIASEHIVGGEVAQSYDYAAHQRDKLPLVIGFVLALTFLMMAITFRSIMVALTAIAINLLSAAAAFGVLVAVFQHTWAEGILKFHSTGAIVSWIPLFLFAVLFGLSMDYHVFVVSRIREGVERGMSTKDAVNYGITRSAGVVTSAAVVMVSVFAIFATLSMIEMKQLGIGLAAAVLIDALVVRIVVLPSLMTLLGRANWWPSKLGRKSYAVPATESGGRHQLERVG